MAEGMAKNVEPVDIDPGRIAPELHEPAPPGAASEPSQDLPTVLKKLQKWGDYPSMGEPLAQTKFLPMKTPLSMDILNNWTLPEAPKYRLTVPDLISKQAAAGRRVGMILDLSNHSCLYTEDIPSTTLYCHIHLVKEVCRVADKFWAEHPDDYIGIHCAYGFNRTGFVCCAYLVEVCGMSVDSALAAFAAARPPGVRHEEFRAELYLRYALLSPEEAALAAAASAYQEAESRKAESRSSAELTKHGMAAAVAATAVAGGANGTQPPQSAAETSTPWADQGAHRSSGAGTHDHVRQAGTSAFRPAAELPESAAGSSPRTPQQAGSCAGATPLSTAMSENESLGLADRIIMQSFRTHRALLQGQVTPDEIDSLVTAATRPSKNVSPSLQRASLGDVIWHPPGEDTAPGTLEGRVQDMALG